MTFLKAALVQSALIAAISGAATAPAQSTASPDVVCNRLGQCWHSRDRLDYPAGVGITFHTDAWGLAHRSNHWRWQGDRFDRGYYRNGVWIAF